MKNKSAVGKWRTNEIAEQKTIFIDGNDGAVAWVFNGYGINDNDRANASLIASAPELLEACEAMMEAWENNAGLRDVISFNTAFQKAHKAIAKAEGRV